MSVRAVVCSLAIGAAGFLAAPVAASADVVQQASSANWAGYAADSQAGFRSVSGSWVQPTVRCDGGASYSAFWVGLGGAGGSGSGGAAGSGDGAGGGGGAASGGSLEQAGTEANCSADGTASYYAWYELVPSAPVRLSLTVNPGDRISSRVTVSGDSVTVTVTDATTGGSASRTLTMANPDISTAEWIAEAPSACDQATGCTPLPLADFGRVGFTSAGATDTAGHTGPISDPSWSAAVLTLSPQAGGSGDVAYAGAGAASAGATPSGLSSGGSAFSVSWSGASASGYSGGGGDTGAAGGGGGYPGPGGGGWVFVYPGGWGYAYAY